MITRPSRRAALAGLLAALPAAALPAAAWADAPLRSLRPRPRPDPNRIPDIDAILAEARLTGRISLAAVDVATGGVIETRGARTGLPPASVMKALTAAYALDTLGTDHRFETRLLATGPVEAGTLKGDLVLAGGGDPTLDTPRLDALAAALAAGGLLRVEGRFLTWSGALPYVEEIDADQDDHLGYNASVSGLNLNFNRVHFSWARRGGGDYAVDMDARGGNLVPPVGTSLMRVVDRRLPVYTYESAGGRDEWTVARRALGQGGARWLPVRNPAAYAAGVLATLARQRGIALPAAQAAEALPEGTVLARDASSALPQITREMLRFSTNLTAEALGLSASLARGPLPEGPPLVASGARMAAWAEERLGLRGATLVDHSGLGDDSRIGAGPLADAMARLARDRAAADLAGGGADLPDLVPLLRGFGMPDARGELVLDGPIRVSAKTGTLNFVSGLGGVARGSGRPVAFAILMADLDARARGLAQGDEIPEGARPWGRRARAAQRALIERWVRLSALSDA